MNNPVRKKKIFMVYFLTFCALIAMMLCPALAKACGPGNPQGTGPGMGRGLNRGYGFSLGPGRTCGMGGMGGPPGPGGGPSGGFGGGLGGGPGGGPGGLNLQRGIMREPSYCRMLIDRPDLNLTSEQRDALRKLQIKHTKETFDIRADLQINKIELRKLRFSQNPDFNLIKAKLEKISKLQLALQVSRVKLQIDADKILTDEQKDALYLSPDIAVDLDWEETMDMEETPPEPNISQ